VKIGRDKTKPEQDDFRKIILSHSGVYIIAQDEDGPDRYLESRFLRDEQ